MSDTRQTSSKAPAENRKRIDFQTEPARYRHWKLKVDGEIATLVMDVDEKSGLFEGYDLKQYGFGTVGDELSVTKKSANWPMPSTGCGSSNRTCAFWCCAPRSRGYFPPAPIFACWRARAMPTK